MKRRRDKRTLATADTTAPKRGKRRHHNNDGRQQIRRGRTREQVRKIAESLGVPYGSEVIE